MRRRLVRGTAIRSTDRRWRFWLLYPLWILFCGLLFVALQHASDPARPAGRITENEAISKAEAALKDLPGSARYRVVHAAWSSSGEIGKEARWVVLLRPRGASGLEHAIVVEVRGDDGRLIRIRMPGEGVEARRRPVESPS